MQLQQENQTAKLNLLRKCGLLAHTSAAFLKTAAPKNFLFACGSYPATNHKPSPPKGADSMAAFSVSTALLDAVVLACVVQGDTYGYELTHQIQSVFSISESTLYPVLRRLQKNEYLQTYDQPYQGRNRRYYHITDAGRTALEAYCSEWQQYKQQVDQFLIKKEDAQ